MSKLKILDVNQHLYIAGPMSGYVDHNFPAFLELERRLRELLPDGAVIHNPARNFPDVPVGSYEYADYFRADMHHLLQCRVIVFLPDWRRSLGAFLEWRIGSALDLSMFEMRVGWERWKVEDHIFEIWDRYIPQNHHRNDPKKVELQDGHII